MSSKIVNSSAGNDYFNIAGTAVSDTVQPNVVGGSVGGLSTEQMPEGKYTGHVPVTKDLDPLDQTGVTTSQITTDNVSPVLTDNDSPHEIYKVRDYKIKTAFRQNKFNTNDNTFDTGYPVTGESTSEIQISGATNPTLNDHSFLNTEITFCYSLLTPQNKSL